MLRSLSDNHWRIDTLSWKACCGVVWEVREFGVDSTIGSRARERQILDWEAPVCLLCRSAAVRSLQRTEGETRKITKS